MAYPPQQPNPYGSPDPYQQGSGYGGYSDPYSMGQSYGSAPPAPPSGGGRTGVVIAIVIGAVLVLGGVGAGVVVLLNQSSAHENEIPEEFGGSWSGTITQYDSASTEMGSFEVQMILGSGATTGYADLYDESVHACSWELDLVSQDEQSLEFSVLATDEEITCVRQSSVELWHTGNSILVEWQGELSDGSQSTADGTLNR